MKRDPKFGWGHLEIAVAVVVVLAALAPALVTGSAKPCCFANDRYEGICKVIPGEGEMCQSILAYLNNPMGTGKSYCDGTSVRGGWVRVDCKTGKPAIKQGAALNGMSDAATCSRTQSAAAYRIGEAP
jgi:hypothetical protein